MSSFRSTIAKKSYFLFIPVILLWIYLTYLIFAHAGGRGPYYKVEFVQNNVSEVNFSYRWVDFETQVEGEYRNVMRIRRIFDHLGGNGGRTDLIKIIKKCDIKTHWTRLKKEKKYCQLDNSVFEGRLRPDLSSHNLTLVVPTPLPCVSRHKVAIIIPYRDREEHLITLLNTLHPLLQRQQIQYRVYVVEQFGNDTFNKGVLMNAGVRESLRDLDFGCFVFHDVDLIPEDDRNMYSCPLMPRHMSVAIDKFNYSLPYPLLVGGVFSIRLDHFLAVNGYSNLYWGWGGEDDDLDLAINLDSDVLENHCSKILEFISFQKLKEVLTDIFYSSICEGLYWSLPFDLLMEKIKQLHPESVNLFTDMISEAMLMESDHVPLNVQILSHHIDKNKKVFYLKNLLGDLIEKDCSQEGINDDFLIKLGEVCCYIQHSESLDDEVKNLFSIFLKSILRFNCPKELEYLFSVQITSLVSSLVKCAPDLITQEIWNHLQLLLSYNIENGKLVEYNRPEDILLMHIVSSQYSTSFSFIQASKDIELSWNPIVSDELNKNFISLFKYIGVSIKKFYLLPQAFKDALTSLLKAIEFIPENILFDCVMQSQATFSEYTSKSERLSSPLDCLLLILLSDIQHLQTAAHVMLIRIMPLLSESVSSFAKSESEDNEDEEEKIPSILLPLVDTFKPLNELMEGMLWDVKFGECCLVLPYTEPYAFVSAYLFAWLQMLEFISTSPFQVRSGYIADLEEGKLLSSLFSNVCRLMPENPMSCLKVASDTPKKESLVSLFLQPPVISAGYPSPEEIQTIACYVFCFALRKVPASVRTWWNNLDKKSADIVNKFTSKYISGILCTEEIQAVHNNGNLFKNMVVKARLGSREVIATYTVDDFTIELCVQLPANYPLGPITAEKRGKVIISTQEWRHWLMQLATVLNYQNGSILDGLNIWKKNLEKKFEGVEECMICYYILHSSTLKLPKVSCNTCRKKFHSACLYKWFHSINNTKCPLCRTEFTINYRN